MTIKITYLDDNDKKIIKITDEKNIKWYEKNSVNERLPIMHNGYEAIMIVENDETDDRFEIVLVIQKRKIIGYTAYKGKPKKTGYYKKIKFY